MTLKNNIVKIAGEFFSHPVSPFREHHVREYIRGFCDARGIAVREDDMGNLFVTYGAEYGKKSKAPVLAFAAHMDHPGFIIEKDSVRGKTTARFYGNVEVEYFVGTKMRVFTEKGEATGRVTKAVADRKKRIIRAHLQLDTDVQRGDIAMWDLVPLRIKNDRLTSRACDDGVGCVSVLALMDELIRKRVPRKVVGVFTVAEEAGLQGAKYICQHNGIPKKSIIIAIETSRELPAARMGKGVVIRVGDIARIFSPEVTRFMEHVAAKVAKKAKAFQFQRALMDGGRCETSIYQASGYTAGAVCVPLGNYHNRNFRTKRIAAEYVSMSDLENMVRLFVGMVESSDDSVRFLRPEPPLYKEERRDLGERTWMS